MLSGYPRKCRSKRLKHSSKLCNTGGTAAPGLWGLVNEYLIPYQRPSRQARESMGDTRKQNRCSIAIRLVRS